MALLLSPIQIADIQILKSSIEVRNFDASSVTGNNTVNFQFESSDLTDIDNGAKQMSSSLAITSIPEEEGAKGYALEIHVRGMFSGSYNSEADSLENFVVFMKVNAFSLLYGYIRSHVQQLSAQMPTGKINLPCIDVGSIAGDLVLEEERCENPAVADD